MIALESTFVPENAADLRATYELRLDEERFSVGVGDGADHDRPGQPAQPRRRHRDRSGHAAGLVFGDRKLAGAPVAIRGDARLARTFFRLFARP